MRPGPRRFCAIRKPAPISPSVFVDRHADAGVAHLAVRRPALAGVAHDDDRAHDLDARRVGGDDDLRRARVRRGVRVGDGHHDPERGAVGARREPLVAVDHPVVAVADRAGAERRRVGAGHLRLGHREERADRRRRRAGASHVAFCSSVPNRWRISALPASGAWQPNTSWPQHRAADVLVQVRVVEEARCRCRLPRAGRAAPRARRRAPRPAAARAAPRPSSS